MLCDDSKSLVLQVERWNIYFDASLKALILLVLWQPTIPLDASGQGPACGVCILCAVGLNDDSEVSCSGEFSIMSITKSFLHTS